MREKERERRAAENDYKNGDPGGWLLTHQWCSLESKIMPGATLVHDLLHPTQKPLPCLSASAYSIYTRLNVINPMRTVRCSPALHWLVMHFWCKAPQVHVCRCVIRESASVKFECVEYMVYCIDWIWQPVVFKLMRFWVPIVSVQWLVLVVRYAPWRVLYAAPRVNK